MPGIPRAGVHSTLKATSLNSATQHAVHKWGKGNIVRPSLEHLKTKINARYLGIFHFSRITQLTCICKSNEMHLYIYIYKTGILFKLTVRTAQ